MKRENAGRRTARNWRSLAAFEALYKMSAVSLFLPLLFGAVSLLMKVNGYDYLTHENITAFLSRPLTALTFAVLLALGALYIMADVSAVIFSLDQSAQGADVTAGQIGRFAFRNTVRACRLENLPIVAMAVFLLPLVSVGFAVGLLATVSVPAFIPKYLRAHPVLPLTAAAVVLVITALGVYWLYTCCCFTVEGCSFSAARRRNAALSRGRRLRDLGTLLITEAAFSAVCAFFLLAVLAPAGLLRRLLSRAALPSWVGSSVLWLAIVLALSVIAAVSVPVGYGCVGVLYYRSAAAAGGVTAHTAAPAETDWAGRSAWHRAAKVLAVCALAAGTAAVGFLFSTGGINPDIEYLRTVQVTAHRGASAFYPENTMAAFAGAMDLGADWIELDVQQSGDGRLVVVHDANLKRITGVNANVWELTYDEIEALDAGRYFSRDFEGEKIPLLEDVLSFAGENGLHLNIELKPTGRENDLEKCVVDAIRSAEMEDACVVTSQSYGVLERVKAYDESITTVYVMHFAYGDIERLSAADHFSVAAESVTRQLVTRVHNAGAELYVWTIDTRQGVNRMIELGVDNIITDDVDMAKRCIYESRYGGLTEDYVDLLGS